MVQPREEYKDIGTYTIARYKQDLILKLDMNENTLGCSPHVIKTLKSLPVDVYSKYPAYGEIEEKIASFFNLSTEKVLITNGGDAGINAVYLTYVNEGDEVIYAVPSYVMYKLDAQRVRARIVQVPYEKKWVYPAEKVIEAITEKTKLIVISSPANPTGDIVCEGDIIRIIEAAPNSMVLLDEAYWRFVDRENKSLYYLINKYNNLTIMHTFSKDYGLAGIRIGYLLSCQENIAHIGKSMDPFSVNNIAVEAGLASMEDPEFVDNYVKHVRESKEYFTEAIKEIADEVYESQANFVCFYVGSKYEWYYAKLLKNRIKIRRYPHNPLLKGYLRVTLGTVDQMKTVLNHFKDYDAIIFDIDGVFVNESLSYRKAIQLTYEFFSGKTITQEEIQEYKNQEGFIDDWILTRHLLSIIGINLSLEEVTEKFQEFYWKDGKGLIAEEKLLLNPEIIKLLNRQYKMAVFTGRPREEAEYILKKEGIIDCFDIIVSSNDVPEGKGKPDSYGINVICDKLKSKNIIYFGDMPDDIRAAEKAGIDSAGILPPQDKSEKLKDLLLSLGAIEVYDNLEKAIECVFGEIEKVKV
ncbi:MAG: aminotransferase class I/II-fold pyridoxal phosphate-dependent enzyme [Cyanobacteriota bacterium]